MALWLVDISIFINSLRLCFLLTLLFLNLLGV